MFECIFICVFILVLAASETAFGTWLSENVRTYFNLLDNNFGRGMIMILLSIMLYAET
jgi:mannitol-specific phosphotransferase system IIBC component